MARIHGTDNQTTSKIDSWRAACLHHAKPKVIDFTACKGPWILGSIIDNINGLCRRNTLRIWLTNAIVSQDIRSMTKTTAQISMNRMRYFLA